MTQPVCAYEGCGRVQDSTAHSYQDYMPESVINHEFQPQSTVESAPLSPTIEEMCGSIDFGGKMKVDANNDIYFERDKEPAAKTGAEGAVPGPQRCKCGGLFVCGFCGARQATPEPHSPHVHNFDANGICVTMGCTPAEEQGNHIVQSPEMVEPAAASTDERPDVYAFWNKWFPEHKDNVNYRYEGWSASAVTKFGLDYAADLLRLVAELRQERELDLTPLMRECDRKWENESRQHIVNIAASGLYWRQKEIEQLTARAEQAERERDELRQTVKKYSQHIGGCHFWSSGSLDKCTCGLRQRIAVLEGGK